MPPPSPPSREDGRFAAIARSIRIDLVIAVCALLISSVTAGASWWQTRVIQQQLSAQVWPYLSVNEDFAVDTLSMTFANDGLGPAILRSIELTVDGKPVPDFMDMMHVILGPHISARRPHGEAMGLDANGLSPGNVLRAGDSLHAFTFRSKHFAPLLARAYRRIDFTMCYCAILPGTCWLKDAATNGDPQPVGFCPERPHDLLHVPADEILNDRF